MKMKNKKLILGGGVIGVIILGVITNAIWDAVKPLTAYLFKLALNLSVLGVDKFKDNIYLEIARGMHEGTSLQIFITLYGFVLSFVLVVVLMALIVRRKVIRERESNANQNFFDKIYDYRINLLRKSWFIWFFVLYTMFTGTILILDLTKQNYINNAVTNFEQLSKIIRPYIDEKEEVEYSSKFSQIRNKEDYVKLVSKLGNIAKDNNLYTPDFSFTF